MTTTPGHASHHWATKFIGRPWSPSWNCWSLVKDVYQGELDVFLPDFHTIDPRNFGQYGRAISAGCAAAEWVQLDKPEEMCVVAMSQSRVFHHVGLWTEIDGGLVVHAQDEACTTADKLPYLKRIGWQKIGFFKWHTL